MPSSWHESSLVLRSLFLGSKQAAKVVQRSKRSQFQCFVLINLSEPKWLLEGAKEIVTLARKLFLTRVIVHVKRTVMMQMWRGGKEEGAKEESVRECDDSIVPLGPFPPTESPCMWVAKRVGQYWEVGAPMESQQHNLSRRFSSPLA